MGKRINWQHWREKFVEGDDSITLEVLSKRKNSPALDSLKKKCAAEGWHEQRKRYQRELENRGVNINGEVKPEVRTAIDRTNKIIDTAEMLTQHNAIATGLLRLAAQGIRAADGKNLKPSEFIQMAKVGIEIQRIIEGMATSKTEIDLKSATDAELDAIIDGNT